MRYLLLVYLLNCHFLFSQQDSIFLQFEAKSQHEQLKLKCPESFSGGKTQFDFYENLFRDTIAKLAGAQQNFTGKIVAHVTCSWITYKKPFYELEELFIDGKLVESRTKYYKYDLFGHQNDSMHNPQLTGTMLRVKRENSIVLFYFDLNGQVESLDSSLVWLEGDREHQKEFGFVYLPDGQRKLSYQAEYLDDTRNGRFFYDFSIPAYPASIEMIYKNDSLIDIQGENLYFIVKNKIITKEAFLKLNTDNALGFTGLDPYYSDLWKCYFVFVYFSRESPSTHIFRKIKKKHLEKQADSR